MKIAVIGATGATGKKVMERALHLGHEVIAVARRPELIAPTTRLTIRRGDVLDLPSIVYALADADVVISCIGPGANISQGNVIREGIANIRKNLSPGTIMSVGMRNILSACQSIGIQRLIMQSGIGVSDGKELAALHRITIRLSGRIFTKAVADKAMAERAVQQSTLDWVIVRPPGLHNADATLHYKAGPLIRISPLRPISFADCADCLVRAATNEPTWNRKIVNVGR